MGRLQRASTECEWSIRRPRRQRARGKVLNTAAELFSYAPAGASGLRRQQAEKHFIILGGNCTMVFCERQIAHLHSMKVLVTGATGFVGQEILRQLHLAGHRSRILTRRPESPRVQELASRYQAELQPGDVLQPATLEASLGGIEAVIHLVGIISELGENTFENVHTKGTQHLLTACRRASGLSMRSEALYSETNRENDCCRATARRDDRNYCDRN